MKLQNTMPKILRDGSRQPLVAVANPPMPGKTRVKRLSAAQKMEMEEEKGPNFDMGGKSKDHWDSGSGRKGLPDEKGSLSVIDLAGRQAETTGGVSVVYFIKRRLPIFHRELPKFRFILQRECH